MRISSFLPVVAYNVDSGWLNSKPPARVYTSALYKKNTAGNQLKCHTRSSKIHQLRTHLGNDNATDPAKSDIYNIGEVQACL